MDGARRRALILGRGCVLVSWALAGVVSVPLLAMAIIGGGLSPAFGQSEFWLFAPLLVTGLLLCGAAMYVALDDPREVLDELGRERRDVRRLALWQRLSGQVKALRVVGVVALAIMASYVMLAPWWLVLGVRELFAPGPLGLGAAMLVTLAYLRLVIASLPAPPGSRLRLNTQ